MIQHMSAIFTEIKADTKLLSSTTLPTIRTIRLQQLRRSVNLYYFLRECDAKSRLHHTLYLRTENKQT